MCRRNKLWSIAFVAFGIGLFIGGRVGCGFFPTCFALGSVAMGILFLQKQA